MEKVDDRQEVALGRNIDATRIVESIEDVRRTNNTNWMDILKIAMRHAPRDTSEVLSRIKTCDAQVNTLTKDLVEVLKR